MLQRSPDPRRNARLPWEEASLSTGDGRAGNPRQPKQNHERRRNVSTPLGKDFMREGFHGSSKDHLLYACNARGVMRGGRNGVETQR